MHLRLEERSPTLMLAILYRYKETIWQTPSYCAIGCYVKLFENDFCIYKLFSIRH
jgi:hypothetical protein